MEGQGEGQPGPEAEDDFEDVDNLEEVRFEKDEAPSDGSDVEVEKPDSSKMGDGEATSGRNTQDMEVDKDADGGTAGRLSFVGHTDSVYCVDLARVQFGNVFRDVAVSGGGDDRAFVWDLHSGETLAELAEHSDTVVGVGFNFDSTVVATASYDATVCVYSASTLKLVRTLQGPSSEIEWFAWHPKGNAIVAGSADATAWIWDASSGNCLGVLAGHEDAVTCGGFTRNGKRVVTGSADGSVKLWDPKSSACVCTFSGHNWQSGGINTLAFHDNEPLIAAGGQDGIVRLVRLDSQKTIYCIQHSQAAIGAVDSESCSIESLSFCKDTQATNLLAIAGTDGIISVWDWVQQSRRHSLKHEGVVIKVQFVRDSFLLVSCSSDYSTRLWDARSGQGLLVLSRHLDMVLDFALLTSEDGTSLTVASVGDDKRCYTHNFTQNQVVA